MSHIVQQRSTFLTKVMCLVNVARSHWNHKRNQRVDGKLEIWPFTSVESMKRKRRNRPAGTPAKNATNSVTNVAYR